jgi:hypothetical protein
MLRVLAFVAMFVLAVPTLAAAQNPEQHGRPGPRPGGPPPRGPMRPPPPGVVRGPVGPHVQFSYHGRMFNPIHISPFVYPPGWGYRRWAVGAILPPLFLTPAYYYTDWATLGLEPPPPGTQWVRYGPDLLLVTVGTGAVVEVVPGVFY